MIIKQKNTETKMKKREEDLELWYTHCLAHHLTGAPNTDYLVYPVVSQESLTCKNTPVAVEMENMQCCCHVSIFAIFVTIPKRVVTTNRYLFDVLHQKYFNLLYRGYSSTQKKKPKFQIIYGEEFIKCERLIHRERIHWEESNVGALAVWRQNKQKKMLTYVDQVRFAVEIPETHKLLDPDKPSVGNSLSVFRVNPQI